MNRRVVTYLVVTLSVHSLGCESIEPAEVDKNGKVSAVEHVVNDTQNSGTEQTEDTTETTFSSSLLLGWLQENCASCHGEATDPKFASSDPSIAFPAASSLLNFTTPGASRFVAQMIAEHNCPYECSSAAQDLVDLIVAYSEEQASEAERLGVQTSLLSLDAVDFSLIKNLDGRDPGYLYFPASAATLLPGAAVGNQAGATVNAVAIEPAERETRPDLPAKTNAFVRVTAAVLPNSAIEDMTQAQFDRAGLLRYDVQIETSGIYRLAAYAAVNGATNVAGTAQSLISVDAENPRLADSYKFLRFSFSGNKFFPNTAGVFRWLEFSNAFNLEQGKHTVYIAPAFGGQAINWGELILTRITMPESTAEMPYSDAYQKGVLNFPLAVLSGKVSLSVRIERFKTTSLIFKGITVTYADGAQGKVRIAGLYPIVNGEVLTDFNAFASIDATVDATKEITFGSSASAVLALTDAPATLGFGIKVLEELSP